MNNKIKFLKSLFLPLFLILFFTINITSDHISDIFSRIGQQASVIKSTRVENIYNISPSKKFPGVFNFEYQYAKLPTNKKEANFDLSILPFDEEKARAVLKQEYGLEYVDFGPIRDAWGYPVRENAFMKKEETKKQSFLDSLKINKALAYDEDTQNPGVYNCRANTSITGYFKAYFEDVALNTSVGFDDPAYGEGRREEACQVLQDISEMIMLDQTNVTPDILFEMNNPSMPPGALAGASSYFDYNSTNPNNGSLHRHIISQQDPTPEAGNFDAFILTNFSVNWSVDSSLNQNTYDFYTVMWHEMMHALGFRRLLPAVISQTGVEHTHGTFDSHTYKDESLQNRFITAVTNLLNVPVGAPSPWFVTNQVVYRGVKNILGATPDGIRPIYSPTSWQQGSSLSHFDMNRAGGEEYVMHPSIGTNTDREIHEHELEVLCHLGYMVEGLAGCEVPTPVAMDDYVFLNETNSVCIKPLINDVPVGPGSLGSLHINSVTPISIEQGDTIDYYSNGNCNGALLPSMYGARSILFTPSSLNVDRVLKYSNKRSNSIRLSNEAVILTLPPLPSCEDVTDPNEYVCNGGFDAVSPPGNEVYSLIHCSSWGTSSNIGAYGYVLNTCNFSGTPDVIMEDSYIPAGFAASSSPAPTGTTFPYLRSGVFDNIGTGHSFERTIMMLGQPLTPGEEYILSFDHAYKGLLPGFEIDFYVIMSTPVSLSMSTPIPNPNQNIFNQVQSGNPLEWHSYSQNFIANNTYISVVFYADGVKNEPQSWNYFDNISIRPVNAPPPPPPPVYLGSLTGHLYQDLNQNGSYQSSTEPRLSGIQVGLFQDGSNMPIQTATTQDIPNLGKYEFTNLLDGDYYVGLIGENLYQSVTQPVVSTDPFPNYNRMHVVNLSNGQTAENLNFGVVLVGDTPPVNTDGKVDIRVTKELVDSSLSLFDRYITWRIDVKNLGDNTATNVQVKEIIPPGLIYHAHQTPNTNAYNNNVHMFYIPTLFPNQQTHIFITMKVPNSPKVCGNRTNIAVLHHLDQSDANQNNNEGSATIRLQKCKPYVITDSEVK